MKRASVRSPRTGRSSIRAKTTKMRKPAGQWNVFPFEWGSSGISSFSDFIERSFPGYSTVYGSMASKQPSTVNVLKQL